MDGGFPDLRSLLLQINSADTKAVKRALVRFRRQIKKEQPSENEVKDSGSGTGGGLLEQYLAGSPECFEVFVAIKGATSDLKILAAAFKLLKLIISPETTGTNENAALTVSRMIVRHHLASLLALLAASDNKIINSGLRTLVAIARRGPVLKELVSKFPWTNKRFMRLPFHAASKNKKNEAAESKVEKVETRKLFIEFVVALVEEAPPDLLQVVLNIKDLFSSIIRNLYDDDLSTVQRILMLLSDRVLLNASLSSRVRYHFFSGEVVDSLVKLYGAGDDFAETAHSFIVLLQQSYSGKLLGAKINKLALLRLLMRLKSNEDAKQLELVISVLQNTPSLHHQYLRQLRYVFEPRPSPRWLGNVALLIRAFELPAAPSLPYALLTAAAFSSNDVDHLNAVQALLQGLFPATLNKITLSKGLQHKSGTVKRETLSLLSALLVRFHSVLKEAVKFVVAELGKREDECSQGMVVSRVSNKRKLSWLFQGPRSFRQEFRKHLPDLQVVLALFNRTHANVSEIDEEEKHMLTHGLVDVLLLFQRVLPEQILEARIDPWKLFAITTPSKSSAPNSTNVRKLACSPLSLFKLVQLLDCAKFSTAKIWSNSSRVKSSVMLGKKNQNRWSNFGFLLELLLICRGEWSWERITTAEDSKDQTKDAADLLSKFLIHSVIKSGVCASSLTAPSFNCRPDPASQTEVGIWIECADFASLEFLETVLLLLVRDEKHVSPNSETKDAHISQHKISTSALVSSALSLLQRMPTDESSRSPCLMYMSRVFSRLEALCPGFAEPWVKKSNDASLVSTFSQPCIQAALNLVPASTPRMPRSSDILESPFKHLFQATFFQRLSVPILDSWITSSVKQEAQRPPSGHHSALYEGLRSSCFSVFTLPSILDALQGIWKPLNTKSLLSTFLLNLPFSIVLRHGLLIAPVEQSFPKARKLLLYSARNSAKTGTLESRLQDLQLVLSATEEFYSENSAAMASGADVLSTLCECMQVLCCTTRDQADPKQLEDNLILHWSVFSHELNSRFLAASTWDTCKPRKKKKLLESKCSVVVSDMILKLLEECVITMESVTKQKENVMGGLNTGGQLMKMASFEKDGPLFSLTRPFFRQLLDACQHVFSTLQPPNQPGSPPPYPLQCLERIHSFLQDKEANQLSALLRQVGSCLFGVANSGAGWLRVFTEWYPELSASTCIALSTQSIPVLMRTIVSMRATDSMFDVLLSRVMSSIDSSISSEGHKNESTHVMDYFQFCTTSTTTVRAKVMAKLFQLPVANFYLRLLGRTLANNITGQATFDILQFESLVPSLLLFLQATSHSPSDLKRHRNVIIKWTTQRILSLAQETDEQAETTELVRMIQSESSGETVSQLVILLICSGNFGGTEKEAGFLVQLFPFLSPKRRQAHQKVIPTALCRLFCRAVQGASRGEETLRKLFLGNFGGLLLSTCLDGLTALFTLKSDPQQGQEEHAVLLLDLLLDLLMKSPLTMRVCIGCSAGEDRKQKVEKKSKKKLLKRKELHQGTIQTLLPSGALGKSVSRFLTSSCRHRLGTAAVTRCARKLLALRRPLDSRKCLLPNLSVMPLGTEPQKAVSEMKETAAELMPKEIPSSALLELLLSQTALISVVSSRAAENPNTDAEGPSRNKHNQATDPILQKSSSKLELLKLLYSLLLLSGSSPLARAETGENSLQLDRSSPLVVVLLAGYGASQDPCDVATWELLVLLFSEAQSELSSSEVRRIASLALATPSLKWGNAGRDHLSLVMEQKSEPAGKLLMDADSVSWVFDNMSASTFANLLGTSGDAGQALSEKPGYLLLDPRFALPFMLQILKNHPSTCKRLLEMGVLSFSVRCMGDDTAEIRKLAYSLLAAFFSVLDAMAVERKTDKDLGDNVPPRPEERYEGVREKRTGGVPGFKEQPQILLLLTVLKNSITTKFETIPGVVVEFVARAIPILLRPSHPLFKAVNKFLLQRPLLDFEDIPMFYSLFNSGEKDFKTHRSWLLQLMISSLNEPRDIAALHRRYAVSILLAFHDSAVADKFTRSLVQKLLARLLYLIRKKRKAEMDQTAVSEEFEESENEFSQNGGEFTRLICKAGVFSWLTAAFEDARLPRVVLVPLIEFASKVFSETSDFFNDYKLFSQTSPQVRAVLDFALHVGAEVSLLMVSVVNRFGKNERVTGSSSAQARFYSQLLDMSAAGAEVLRSCCTLVPEGLDQFRSSLPLCSCKPAQKFLVSMCGAMNFNGDSSGVASFRERSQQLLGVVTLELFSPGSRSGAQWLSLPGENISTNAISVCELAWNPVSLEGVIESSLSALLKEFESGDRTQADNREGNSQMLLQWCDWALALLNYSVGGSGGRYSGDRCQSSSARQLVTNPDFVKNLSSLYWRQEVANSSKELLTVKTNSLFLWMIMFGGVPIEQSGGATAVLREIFNLMPAELPTKPAGTAVLRSADSAEAKWLSSLLSLVIMHVFRSSDPTCCYLWLHEVHLAAASSSSLLDSAEEQNKKSKRAKISKVSSAPRGEAGNSVSELARRLLGAVEAATGLLPAAQQGRAEKQDVAMLARPSGLEK